MRQVISAFIVHTGLDRNTYQLRLERWLEKFTIVHNERRITEEVEGSIDAWIISDITSDGKRSDKPVLIELRDGNNVTWSRYDGLDSSELKLPQVMISEILTLDEARQPNNFVGVLRNGGTRVFFEDMDI